MSKWISTFILMALVSGTALAQSSEQLPLIDSHSQIDLEVERDDLVSLMDKAGISHVILSARSRVKPGHIAKLARKHPNRITASVRTKGGVYRRNHPKYYERLDAQLGMTEFKAMAEVIMWHAQKGDKAPKVVIPFDSEQVQTAFNVVKERNWPFVVHIEYEAAGRDGPKFLKSFRDAARSNPNTNFVLIHMGQLTAEKVEQLIKSHLNVYFLTSHTTPPSVRKTNQPWTILFDGDDFKPEWAKLMTDYADRFVFALDNVWRHHWYDEYEGQTKLWRQALSKLPKDAAHAIAHKNAERLWKLSPLK